MLATCDIPDSEQGEIVDALGIKLDIGAIASDSDGQSFSDDGIEASRQWYAKRRNVLQSVGTKSAKRRLRKLSSKQAKFQKDTNHVISKQLVTKAKATQRGIVLEDLKGNSKTVRREERRLRQFQRSKHGNWSFNQLHQFLTYKSILYGVRLTLVDPAYPSPTCNQCGHCEKANHQSQVEFVCRSCGHSDLTAVNAAKNIKAASKERLGLVNWPMVSTLFVSGTSPAPVGGGS